MKTINTTIYECEFCRKYYKRKHFAIYHESVCNKNPENNRACYGCVQLEKNNASIYAGYDNYYTGEPIYEDKEFFFCNKKKIFLYTPKNAAKGNHNHIDTEGGNFEHYIMPKECELNSKNWT